MEALWVALKPHNKLHTCMYVYTHIHMCACYIYTDIHIDIYIYTMYDMCVFIYIYTDTLVSLRASQTTMQRLQPCKAMLGDARLLGTAKRAPGLYSQRVPTRIISKPALYQSQTPFKEPKVSYIRILQGIKTAIYYVPIYGILYTIYYILLFWAPFEGRAKGCMEDRIN